MDILGEGITNEPLGNYMPKDEQFIIDYIKPINKSSGIVLSIPYPSLSQITCLEDQGSRDPTIAGELSSYHLRIAENKANQLDCYKLTTGLTDEHPARFTMAVPSLTAPRCNKVGTAIPSGLLTSYGGVEPH